MLPQQHRAFWLFGLVFANVTGNPQGNNTEARSLVTRSAHKELLYSARVHYADSIASRNSQDLHMRNPVNGSVSASMVGIKNSTDVTKDPKLNGHHGGPKTINADKLITSGSTSYSDNQLLNFTHSAESTTAKWKNICKIAVAEKSIKYFRTRLQIDKPNFIRFKVVFGSKHVNYTSETFYPFDWVWTYNSTRGIYPYLYWNLDYGVLSFELLNVKTLDDGSFIFFNVTNCNLTLGTRETTELIAKELTVLVSKLSNDQTITEYQQSYWCFMAESPGFRDSLGYYMGLYLEYPESILNYNCCYTFYNYTSTRYEYACMNEQMKKWVQCTIGPYILGIILYLYFPIVLLKAGAWSSAKDIPKVYSADEDNERTPLISERPRDSVRLPVNSANQDEWLYLDGNIPKSFYSLFSTLISDRFPVALSRFKRLLFVLLSPSIVFVQIWIYKQFKPETTAEIIARGVPIGFLALLGNTSSERAAAFVPVFGGPEVLLISYYILGIIFLVFPKNAQDIIENGISGLGSDNSPLGFNAEEIKVFSKLNVSNKNGYDKAYNLILCSVYMLFSGKFWKRAVEIQKNRLSEFCFQYKICKCLVVILFPFYIAFCVTELLICILYFSIPVCSSITMVVSGAVKTIAITIRSNIHASNGSIIYTSLKSTFVVALFSFIVALLFVFYVYSFCLVFIQSFFFVSQILVYCYVAVLVYPSVSFGYLFFGVVLLYYIFRLIGAFGVKYLDLLNDIVEIVLMTEEQDNYTSLINGQLVISNMKISRIRSIKINDTVVPVAQNILQSLQDGTMGKARVLTYKNNTYGIRKDLFDHVVNKHLPIHLQVLKIVFHLSMIILCLLITVSLTARFNTGPPTEISDVMHVIFIVTVGALPRVLEVAMQDSCEHIHRDIRRRQLEETINWYWKGEKAKASGENRQSHEELLHMSLNNG